MWCEQKIVLKREELKKIVKEDKEKKKELYEYYKEKLKEIKEKYISLIENCLKKGVLTVEEERKIKKLLKEKEEIEKYLQILEEEIEKTSRRAVKWDGDKLCIVDNAIDYVEYKGIPFIGEKESLCNLIFKDEIENFQQDCKVIIVYGNGVVLYDEESDSFIFGSLKREKERPQEEKKKIKESIFEKLQDKKDGLDWSFSINIGKIIKNLLIITIGIIVLMLLAIIMKEVICWTLIIILVVLLGKFAYEILKW